MNSMWHVLQAILETLATLRTAAYAAKRISKGTNLQAFSESRTWEVVTTGG